MQTTRGFTLVEVLITLGVIGVVAAMTLPTVVAKYKEKQTVVTLKRSYSILNQAFLRATQDYGPPSSWSGIFTSGGGCGSCAQKIAEILSRYINRIEACYEGTYSYDENGNLVFDKGEKARCGGSDRMFPKQLNGSLENVLGNIYVSGNFARSVFSDGTLFITATASNNCTNKYGTGANQNNYCGYVFLDVNGGNKPPNQYGVDLFPFYLTETGFVPFGVDNSFNANTCKTSSSGIGCTAWVLIHENLNYLH